MPREIAGTISQLFQMPGRRETGYQYADLPHLEATVENLTNGMVNRLPRDQVPQGSARLLANARTKDDWVGIRPGTGEYGGTKPNSEIVTAIITYINETQDVSLIRITQNSFNVSNAAADGWTSFSILDAGGAAATFPARARFDVAQFFDKLYLADGVNPIWEVDFSANTVQQIDGAPKAKYIETFADRIVAANVATTVGGLRASTVMWSASTDPTVWDPAVNITAGETDLALERIGDEITGLAALNDNLVILRRTSIWVATRQPFSQSPLRFDSYVSGIGCDMPYTLQKIPNGILFGDQRTKDVYLFDLTSAPQPLGAAVSREMLSDLTSLGFAQGAYDPFEREYHLGVVEDGQTNISKTWVISLDRGAISYDSGPANITTLGVVSLPIASVAIDDLVGTIDAQTGTIDDYGGGGQVTPSLFKGTSTGEVLRQSYDFSTDWDSSTFTFSWHSPNLGSSSNRRTFKDIIVRALVPTTGVVTIEQSRDETTWENTTAPSYTGATTRQAVRAPKTQLTGDDLYFRVTTAVGGFRMYSWFVRMLQKNRQR